MGSDADRAVQILLRTECVDVLVEQLQMVTEYLSMDDTRRMQEYVASYTDENRDRTDLVEGIAQNAAAALTNVCLDEPSRVHLIQKEGAIASIIRGCSICIETLFRQSAQGNPSAAIYSEAAHDLFLALAGLALNGELGTIDRL